MPGGRSRKAKQGSPRRPAQRRPASAAAAPPAPARRLRLPPRVDAFLGRIPFIARRRAASQFRRSDILASCPYRNEAITWELREPPEDSDEPAVVVLSVPRRQDRWGRLLNRFFEGPAFRQVVLDELGTDVWLLCDGTNSIDDLIGALARKHKLERREVELSLTLYLRTLGRRGFIGLKMKGGEQQS